MSFHHRELLRHVAGGTPHGVGRPPRLFDRDRIDMPPLSPSTVDPVSSGEIQTLDPVRLETVERRHRQLAEFLRHCNFDALLITDPATIGWATAGSRLRLARPTAKGASLFITPQARVVICRSSESGQIFDREVAGLGFQLKERPWEQGRDRLIADLCTGRRVAGDDLRSSPHDVSQELRAIRRTYDGDEAERMRSLGHDVTQAVEATGRAFAVGETEAEVAGHLTHRLMRHGVAAVSVQVLADAQGHRYRHWTYGCDPIQRYATLRVVGQRDGLFVGVARTVSFGPPPRAIRNAHEVASLIQATGMFFSQVGWTASDTWQRVARMYEKLGAVDEWRLAEQAGLIGYAAEELPVTPDAGFTFEAGTFVQWHPSVRTGMVADTMMVREEGFELLTIGERWPRLKVVVKGHAVDRPGIFVREESGEWAI